MSVNPDVLVVGGGVVGSACARELARAGRSVMVVEPGSTAGQGWSAAAGLLAPQVEGGQDDQFFDIGLAGREYYATESEALESATGVTFGLRLGGVLQMASTDDEGERLRQRVAWQRQRGLYCDWLSPEEVAEQWPMVGDNQGALWAPQDGALEPAGLVRALIADGERMGVRRVADRVTALESAGNRIIKARGEAEFYFGDIVLAAGAWSGRITGLPRPVSVEPVRGQMAAFARPQALPDLVVYGQGHYVLTRGEEVLAGSTVEHVGFLPEVSPQGIAEVRQAAGRICHSLGGLEPTRTWAGLRPGTPDGLPIIGREPRAPNLWYATGHGRNGVLLAGITGLMLAQMMAGEATLDTAASFAPERFWS